MTSAVAFPALRSRTFYVPRFGLFLEDRPVNGSLLHDVMQVTYKDSIDAIDTFELTVNNWDAERRTFKHLDSALLNPGQKVRLHLGYLDDTREHRVDRLPLMMQGTITDLSPTFPAAGQPTLKVTGQNILNSFCKEKRSDAYSAPVATTSKVAQKICTTLGVDFRNLTPQRAREVSHEHLIQDDQFDIIFLMQLARDEGYELVVHEHEGQKTVLEFVQATDSQSRVFEFRYGATLTEFQPSLSTAKQVSSVTVQGWDQSQGVAIKVEVKQDSLSGNAPLAKKLLPGSPNPVEERKEVLTSQPVRNQQAAQALGMAVLTRINQEAVTGTGSVVGIPELKAGAHLFLWGLGKRFSGQYFVTGTTHSMSMSGYTTQFECRLETLLNDPHQGRQS